MRYRGNVVRPTSESSSYILQVTYGCSHNGCTHCEISLLDKRFEIRPLEQVLEDIDMARYVRAQTERVFLADGNALVLETGHLVKILDKLNQVFHSLKRVGTYASPKDILDKSDEELGLLKEKKLSIVYLCFGSGSDEVLERIHKDMTAAEIIAASKKAQKAGLQLALTAVLGLGGEKYSRQHIEKSAHVVNQINPDYVSMLTLTLARGTKLHKQWLAGEFNLLYPRQTLRELRQFIELLDENNQFLLNTKHASNEIKLQGDMPQDRKSFLKQIDSELEKREKQSGD